MQKMVVKERELLVYDKQQEKTTLSPKEPNISLQDTQIVLQFHKNVTQLAIRLVRKPTNVHSKILQYFRRVIMEIVNAWYADPAHVVIEFPDLSLKKFAIFPARKISPRDLRKYTGVDPSSKTLPEVPNKLLHQYGLHKKNLAVTKYVTVRLTEIEKERLVDLAMRSGKKQSDWLRPHILPALRNNVIDPEENS